MALQHPCAKMCQEVVLPRVLPLMCSPEHVFPGHQLSRYALISGGSSSKGGLQRQNKSKKFKSKR